MPAHFDYDAVIIGSGPNGLAAAITLAREGWSVLVLEAGVTVGGGTRSAELTLPGITHDVCSAIHPLGAGSPFFRSLPLAEHGLEWIHPPAPLAHPLHDGEAVVVERSVAGTAAALGPDADA
jgi:phytoene dehydrogenase-like protein